MILDTFLNIRITPDEKELLDRLAQETGRSRSNVARGLILLAVKDPKTIRALGELPRVTANQAERVT